MTFIDFPIGSTGLVLLCLSTGEVVIERFQPLIPFYEDSGDITGVFDTNSFVLFREGKAHEFEYGMQYAYKKMPVLKAWLQKQELIFQ